MRDVVSFAVVYSDGSEEDYKFDDIGAEIAAALKMGLTPRRIVGLNDRREVIRNFDYDFQVILKERILRS